MRISRRLGLLLSPVLAVAAVLIGGSVYLRHRPLDLPASLRFPAASERSSLSLRYLGIAGYEIDDGNTVILVDPTVTRPTLFGLFLGRLRPDERLAARVFPRADYILVKHAHYDHAVDVPAIALRTGATVVGSQSAVNLALSRGVPPERTILAKPGDRLSLGGFTVDVRAYQHSKILGMEDVMTGTIPSDAGKLWWWQYLQDGSLSYRLESRRTSIWFAGPSTFEGTEVPPAGSLAMGVAGHQYDAQRLKRILERARPKRFFPSHYDNFFQPLSKGLGRMPVVDLEAVVKMTAAAAPGLPIYFLDHNERIELPEDQP
ncbi:MAG: MBL fold metallo-hydrolase [Elusimicrobiota bacterium]